MGKIASLRVVPYLILSSTRLTTRFFPSLRRSAITASATRSCLDPDHVPLMGCGFHLPTDRSIVIMISSREAEQRSLSFPGTTICKSSRRGERTAKGFLWYETNVFSECESQSQSQSRSGSGRVLRDVNYGMQATNTRANVQTPLSGLQVICLGKGRESTLLQAPQARDHEREQGHPCIHP